jgi:hypothetical protein
MTITNKLGPLAQPVKFAIIEKVYYKKFVLEGGLLPVTYWRGKLRTSPLIAISQQRK